MDKQFVERWITALRATDAKQIRGDLFDCEGGFCALGILGEDVMRLDDMKHGDVRPYNFADEILEDITEKSPEKVHGMPGAEYVWFLNDSVGLSFKQIADKLEKLLDKEG